MIARLVEWCTHHSRTVVALAAVAAVAGEWSRRTLPRDAVPDLSDPQIAVFVDWMGHPAVEVAGRVTQLLTEALRETAGATAVRGATMSGMAYVDVVFGSASSLEPALAEIRARVERLRPRLPATARVQIGPPASATGWIYQYALVDPSRPHAPPGGWAQDRLLRPALEAIPGVAEVASVGEEAQEVLVSTEPDQLRARGVAFDEVAEAIRSHASLDVNRFDTLPLPGHAAPGGAPLRIGDVAHVQVAADMPIGVADLDGRSRTVGGIVVARRDADPRLVIERVRRTLDELRPRLPYGLRIVTVYDRLDLADRVEHTLLRALAEEVAVVVLVILLFLLHGRSALVPLATLPLVLLLTFAGMRALGIPATIMSLGGIGIALGMAVDADVVALEACHRRLEGPVRRGAARRRALIAAAGSFAPAILTALLITALSFLPVLTFTGETGRLLRPLALAKTLVIAAAAIVALTAAPALRALLVRGRVLPEFGNPLTRRLVRIYRPFVHFALSSPTLTVVTASLAVLSAVPLLTHLGGEFLPRVDEGDLLYMPTTLPGAPPGEAGVQLRKLDRELSRFPEVAVVFGKVGRAGTATDPAPFSMIETTIRLRPRAEWPRVRQPRWYSSWAPPPLRWALGRVWPEERQETTAELVEKLDRATRFPGWANAWTAPARARMDMMATTGVRTPVGIRVVAADPARLDALGTALQKWVGRLRGTRSAVFEQLGGEPWLTYEPDPDALARHGVSRERAQSTADLVITGGLVGDDAQQDDANQPLRPYLRQFAHSGHRANVKLKNRLPYRLRVEPDMRMAGQEADRLRDVTVRSASGQPVPLGLVGRPVYVTAPAAIRTENGEMVAYLYVDLAPGTDVATYVREGQRELDRAIASEELRLAPAERIEWTGQYELLAEGQRRLTWIALLVVLSMIGLLYLQFRSWTEAFIVLASVPFALVGSCWTLFLLGYPLSAPVWVGLLSTIGLAMQTGVVMVVYIDDAFHRRMRQGRIRTRDDIVAAHAEGTIRRLRPKLMTVTTMAAGLLPLLWADGSGAEVMKRVAAPMLGGLVTSALLTLEVLPVLYTIWRGAQLRRALRAGPDAAVADVLRPAVRADDRSALDPEAAVAGVHRPVAPRDRVQREHEPRRQQ